jgi:hypothetical protein
VTYRRPTTSTDPTGHLVGSGGGGNVQTFFCCGADAWNAAMDWIDAGGLDDLSPSPLDAPLITQAPTMASMLSVGSGAGGGANELAPEDSVCRLEETACKQEEPTTDVEPALANRSDRSDSQDDDQPDCDGCVIGAKGGKQNHGDTGLRPYSDDEIIDMYRRATGTDKLRLQKELKFRKLKHRAGADQRRPERPQQDQPAEEQQPEQNPNQGQGPAPDPVEERSTITAGEAVGATAGGLSVGVIIWWALKVASPLCGPAAPACAVVL